MAVAILRSECPSDLTFATADVNAKRVEAIETNEFEGLVAALKEALGSSSGLTSDDVDVDYLMAIMNRYRSRQSDWATFEFRDASQSYTRNLVDEGNGKSNLLILVWSPQKGSKIHDHGNAHCIMKILRGNLTETRYEFPDENTGSSGQHEGAAMRLISEKTHRENAVAYMADDLGVHQMWNRGSGFAVSLHLYTPPNVARSGCHVFDPATSQKCHIAKCKMFSVYGKRMPE